MSQYPFLLLLVLLPLLTQAMPVHAVDCYVSHFNLNDYPTDVDLDTVFTVTATVSVMCTGPTGEFVTVKLYDGATGNPISVVDNDWRGIIYTSNTVNMTQVKTLIGKRGMTLTVNVDGASLSGITFTGWMMNVHNMTDPYVQNEDRGGGGDHHGGHHH